MNSIFLRLFCSFLFLQGAFIFAGQKPKLSDYAENVYSQSGEDGVLRKIFEMIGTSTKVCIEFGAADGFWLSNTANLWSKDPSWSAVLIESDPRAYNELVAHVAPYRCVTIHRAVGTSSHNSLEAILDEAGIDSSIDLLSIDIDGNDYYIFNSLTKLRPRVIVCEYNQTIPAHLDVYPSEGNYIGCSVAALQRVAAEKGYQLVSINNTNCIFVIDSEYHKFAEYDTDRDSISMDQCVAYIISDYAGYYKIIGPENFSHPWGWRGVPSSEVCHVVYPPAVTKP